MVRNSKYVTSIPSSISLRDAPTQSMVDKANLNETIPARSFAGLMQLIQICVPWLLRDMSSMREISAHTLGLRSRATETSISEIPRGSLPPLQGRDCRLVASGQSDDPGRDPSISQVAPAGFRRHAAQQEIGAHGKGSDGPGNVLRDAGQGAGNGPRAFSISAATASDTSSRQGCATTCTPIGNPSSEVPARTTVLGQPVRLKACA
jgi:hypothetical protein